MVIVCTEKPVLSVRLQSLTFTEMSRFFFLHVMAYAIDF